jgi:nucleoside-diphosphate-sugar epimerase
VRVFLAGASGAIGRPLTRRLVAAGHDVTAMTRRVERAEAIRAAGARPVVCDALEAEPLAAAVAEAEPDVVIHELTALPERLNPRKPALYEPTNRVRSEGTRNLIAAARAAGVRRLICQSIAFAYAHGSRPEVKDEDAPLFLDAPPPFGVAVRVIQEMELAVLRAPSLEGVVLRYGLLYGPGTWYADSGSTARDVRKRRFPVVGRGGGLFSFIHVDDAAAATVAALERGAPGAYNIVDDAPAPMCEWLPAYAEAIGARRPMRMPLWLARLAGGPIARGIDTQPGALNLKAKRELGWTPRWSSWREGFREAPR